MKNITTTALAFFAAVSMVATAGAALTPAQEAVAKAAPKNMKIMIAGFGTIESMTKVDAWLGEQCQPNSNLNDLPTLSNGEALANPNLSKEVARLNWMTRRMEYIRDSKLLSQENERQRQMLTALRTKVLSDDSMRYVPLAKDYLQVSLLRKAGNLIQIIDRSNADMALVEQALNGNNESTVNGATCIITVAMGDREVDSKNVRVNGKGTRVKSTTYTQPYVGKIRDLNGNVLYAFSGTSTWSSSVNSVVQSTVSDPARKLVEAACDKIADDIVNFFTTKIKFKVKAPKGIDKDDVEIALNGKDIDIDDSVRVLAIEHALVATLEGCKPIRKVIAIEGLTGSKTVRLRFKKKEAAKVVAESDGDDDDDDDSED